MPSVKDELVRIHQETEALVSLAESRADLSADVFQELRAFRDEVQAAISDHALVTGALLDGLGHKLDQIRERCVMAIEDAGALLYQGQAEQARAIGGSVLAGGVLSGLFSLLGTVVAGRLISDTISESSRNRPPNPEELKEKALLLVIAELEAERAFIPAEVILQRAAGGDQAIMSQEEARRMLLLLSAAGVLENPPGNKGSGFRLCRKHPKVTQTVDAYFRAASGSGAPDASREGVDSQEDQHEVPARSGFIDLGAPFGLTLSYKMAALVEYLQVHKSSPGRCVVRIKFSKEGVLESKELGEADAEQLRIEVEKKLNDFVRRTASES